jgi:hypothetical protein
MASERSISEKAIEVAAMLRKMERHWPETCAAIGTFAATTPFHRRPFFKMDIADATPRLSNPDIAAYLQ